MRQQEKKVLSSAATQAQVDAAKGAWESDDIRYAEIFNPA